MEFSDFIGDLGLLDTPLLGVVLPGLIINSTFRALGSIVSCFQLIGFVTFP